MLQPCTFYHEPAEPVIGMRNPEDVSTQKGYSPGDKHISFDAKSLTAEIFYAHKYWGYKYMW